jgi:hypothetical protein
MLASVAHAACPSPLKAQSGWFAEVYDKRAPFDDKQGLISPPPSNSMNVALPISFAQLDPGGDQFPNVAFTSSPPTMVDRSTEGRASRQGGPPVRWR